ncbi:transcription factor HES-2-like [Chanos chanos]|uniref:Transcription factor HES-2-like n=1 Tax=Chanos chanos TaxID=29144 RepID=A0A6J2WA56_CHACN|nr:transcription factor HES-2-like [Chanos chanos]
MPPSTISDITLSYAHRTVAMRREATELRRTLKPLLEKRRRARINESLSQLKTLILPLMGKDNCRYSKLEKADILEMTVRFLTETPVTRTKGTDQNFKDGYKACLQRVSTLVQQANLDEDVHQQINDFIQQSVVSATPVCQNCCAQSSRLFPQLQQRLLNLKSTGFQTENHRDIPIRPIPNRAALPYSANMWRPW